MSRRSEVSKKKLTKTLVGVIEEGKNSHNTLYIKVRAKFLDGIFLRNACL